MLACALVYSWWQSPREAPRPSRSEVAEQRRHADRPPAQTTPQPPTPVSAPVQNSSPAAAADGAAVRVGLSADEKTWISISSDGKNVFANALQAHETKTVEAAEKVRLLIGNAGGLEISLNGKPIGPVGPKGPDSGSGAHTGRFSDRAAEIAHPRTALTYGAYFLALGPPLHT